MLFGDNDYNMMMRIEEYVQVTVLRHVCILKNTAPKSIIMRICIKAQYVKIHSSKITERTHRTLTQKCHTSGEKVN